MSLLIAFVFGIIVGSFLNVCILRLPKNESIVSPGSHCPACSHAIGWQDNIPILSYLFLKGRCRHCKAVISWQYLFVEFLTGILFVVFTAFFKPDPFAGAIYLGFSLLLLVLSAVDFRHRVILSEIAMPGILLGVLASAFLPRLQHEAWFFGGLLASVHGAIVGAGALYLIAVFGETFFKKEAMGGGDLNLLAMIGAFLGWKAVLWTIFVSSFLGVLGHGHLLFRKTEDKTLPYGPYLSLAAFLYIFIGDASIQWYLSRFRFY